MKKATAFALFGVETDKDMAAALGVTRQAIHKWPVDGPLPRDTADRVLAAYARRFHRQKRKRWDLLDDAASLD